MKIHYYGHCSFQITLTDETTLLIDPFRNASPSTIWFSQPFPRLSPDIVLITHPHFDHDNVSTLVNTPTIIRDPLTIEGPHFKITGIADKHARGVGKQFGRKNIIFVLEAEGMSVCHWGDNRPHISQALLDSLGGIDVLMIPVDESRHILEFEEVDDVINRLQPKIVFPTHYFIEGLNSSSSGLGGISNWLREQPIVKSIASDWISLDASTLPPTTEVWVFEEYSKEDVSFHLEQKSRKT